MQALCPGFTYSEFHDTLGFDRSVIPRSLWMSADEVVDESLRGLDENKLIVIPGWRYRIIASAMRWLPKFLMRAILIQYGRRIQAHSGALQ